MEIQQPDGAQKEQSPQLDEFHIQLALSQLRTEQNLGMGIGAGAIGAAVGAALWAFITVVTNFQIGWMAVGVGFLVGIAIRRVGKGVDNIFGIAGAVLALLGCLLGDLLAICGSIASEEKMSFFEVLSKLDVEITWKLMVASFSPFDLLFYGIAVYEGYKLSFRQLTERDLMEKISGSPISKAG